MPRPDLHLSKERLCKAPSPQKYVVTIYLGSQGPLLFGEQPLLATASLCMDWQPFTSQVPNKIMGRIDCISLIFLEHLKSATNAS